MGTTENFHNEKLNLEDALRVFLEAAEADGRDVLDELNDAIHDSSNGKFKVTEE